MTYSNVKQKNKNLSTGVTSMSSRVVTSMSPHLYNKNQEFIKKRARYAHACEIIGNHNLTRDKSCQIRPPETTSEYKPFFDGVGFKAEKKTERQRPVKFGVFALQKSNENFNDWRNFIR